MRATCIALLLIAGAAHAKSFCGFALNFANEMQAKVHVKAYKVVGDDVSAKLVCSKWHSICNGKVGKIHATASTFPNTTIPIVSGALEYGTKLVCGVYCQVDGTLVAPNELVCRFNCPAGSNAVQVSFTVGKTTCKTGPYH